MFRIVPRGPAGPGACPVCRDRFTSPPAVTCPTCQVALHAECHALLLRCATFGCAGSVRTFRGATRAVVLARWELFQRMRRDRHGTSLRGHDLKTDAPVELYYLDTIPSRASSPGVVEPLAQAAAGDVPGGVPILASGVDPNGDRPFLVRELVPGDPLPTLLRRRGPLLVEETMALGAALLGYLERLHAAGQVHGGIAPDRLLVVSGPDDGPDALRVSGKGLGRLLGQGREPGPDEPSAVGLLAPEALDAPGGPPADVYAAGVVLYWALVGKAPIEGKDLRAILQKKMAGQHTPLRSHLSRIAPPVEAAIESLLRPMAQRPTAAAARWAFTALGG